MPPSVAAALLRGEQQVACFIAGVHQAAAHQRIKRGADRRAVASGACHELALRHPVAPLVAVTVGPPANRLSHDNAEQAPLRILERWHHAIN